LNVGNQNRKTLSSALKKKHQVCNYHSIGKANTAKMPTFGYVNTSMNLADVCTKPLGATLFSSFLKLYIFQYPKFIEATKPKRITAQKKTHLLLLAVATAQCNIAI
jgi:hypothetical protein